VKKLLVALLLVVAAVLAAAWYYHRETRTRTIEGSPTVEFHPKAEPAAKPRPVAVIRTRPWPMYGLDPQRTRDAPQFHLRPPFRRVWRFRAHGVLEFPPVVGYGRIFFVQGHGYVYAVNVKTGRVSWHKHFRHCAAASPALGKDVVYVAFMQPYPCSTQPRTQRGFIVAFRVKGGRPLWRFPAGAVESSPLLVKNTLYFGSWDHYLYAVDVRTHRLRWRFHADDELNSAPAYADGTIYIGSDGGHVYAVYARSGRLRWSASSFSRFGRREYFYATPAVAYGRVYIGNTDGTVYAYGATTGHLLWARRTGTYVYTAAAIWRKTVYVGSYDGNVYALSAATGDVRWVYHSPSSIHGAPAVVNGIVYFANCGTCGEHGSRSAKLGRRGTFALDARTGKLLWRFGDGKYSPVVADSEHLYLVGYRRLYAFTPRVARSHRPAHARRRAGKRARSR
jgi:outer membrane protein assembly factor BamB